MALTPVKVPEDEDLQIFQITDAAKEAVAKAKAKRKSRALPLASISNEIKRAA